ncbi:transposase [Nocardia brevicatena]|uniref:transposase n=1 Tax=Nocardia brevicatena TaxID=37327 RepID=UPI00278BB6A6|nr:transposase [Nocardia brevicatena]
MRISSSSVINQYGTLDLVQLRYNFRVYPTPGRRIALAQAFGCARVVYNDALAARETARAGGLPYIKDAELSKALTAAKKDPDRMWLGEMSSVVLQQALADLNTAYRNFSPRSPGNERAHGSGRPGFGLVAIIDRRSGSRRTPGSRSQRAGNCGCRRSGM